MSQVAGLSAVIDRRYSCPFRWPADCTFCCDMQLKPVCRAQELRQEFGLKATIGLAFRKLISPVARAGSVYLMECDLRAGLPAVTPVQGIFAREAFIKD